MHIEDQMVFIFAPYFLYWETLICLITYAAPRKEGDQREREREQPEHMDGKWENHVLSHLKGSDDDYQEFKALCAE